MVKKLKAQTKSDDRQLAEAVRTSAQQIWQAGLGAYAKAQEEGGKVFAKLVKEGTDLQQRTQKLAGDKVSGVSDTVSKMADSVSKQASGSWDKLEQVFEDRVARSLASLGVPSQKDILALTQRVEALTKSVATLSGKKTVVASKPAAKKVVVTKSAVKPTVKPAAKAAAKATNKAATKQVIKTSAKGTTKRAAKPSTAAKS